MKNQISKELMFLSNLANTVRIFLARIQLAVYKKYPASENRPRGEKQEKSCHNPRNDGLQQLYGTLERTLTSDLPLRRRLLYTTELLGHINFWAYAYAKKDSNELPLRRRMLYPAELRRHEIRAYFIQFPMQCQDCREEFRFFIGFSNFLFTDFPLSAIIN